MLILIPNSRYIKQQIVETENKLNFLLGRFPQPILRNPKIFPDMNLLQVQSGIPSQLLRNRPDIKEAELQLMATRLEIKSAKAEFYPSLKLDGVLGWQAFSGNYLVAP
jgi:outer membrane protein TolC